MHGASSPEEIAARTGIPGPWTLFATLRRACTDVWQSEGATVLVASREVVARHLAGYEDAASHAARPRDYRAAGPWIACEPIAERAPDPTAVLAGASGPIRARTLTVREHLRELLGRDVSATALIRAGLGRPRTDRLLAAWVRTESMYAASLGIVDREAIVRTAARRIVSLAWDGARAEGPLALDCAALGVEASRSTEDATGGIRGSPMAREIAQLAVAIRDADSRAMNESVERLFPAREPQRVHVFIDGPEWLDRGAWLPHGAQTSPAEARRIYGNLDGLVVARETLRVRTEPLVRVARGAPTREDARARSRRLFTRWDEGIRTDEEGLVSATPEVLANFACRFARGVVMDGTAGIGSLTIALARRADVTRVIAVDRDHARLAMAKHNVALYGLASKVSFVCADVGEVLARERVDELVLDPPWGVDYDRTRVALTDLGMDVASVLARAPARVTLKLPRSFDPETLPGTWRYEAAVDSRGSLKFLVARRG